MFDWNDQDQVGDTIWGESNENEDHIVPYSKDSEDNTVFTFGDYQKKQKNNDAGANGRCTEQTSGVKNEFPVGSLKNCSSFNSDEEHSAPELDLDAWPDLPSLNLDLSKGYTCASDHDSLLSEKVTVQLDGEAELFGNENEDKESNSFLDCDWSNIGDFDDLDRIFRNDSIFGHDMVADVDAFLSQSTDVIGSTAQSIPLSDLPESRDQAPDQDCSSDQLIDHSGRETISEVKAGYRTVGTSEKTICQDQLSEKEDRKKKLLKSRKKAEERSKNKAMQNLNGSWPQNISQQFQNPVVRPSLASPLHGFQPPQPPLISQQRATGGAESTGHLGCSNQIMLSHYGYPPHPGMPVVQHVDAEEKHRKTVSVGRKFYPDSSEHSNISNKMPELQSRQLSMTPQEKIEKLRRRQQIQAMLAIQQQQQQFSHQMTGTKSMASEGNSQKNQTLDAVTNSMGIEENQLKLPPSDTSILMDYDESQNISALIDDNSLEETIYYQLQDALQKVDIRVRLCIQDSLFRLAESSMERQRDNDRSSTNKSARDGVLGNQEKNLEQRHTSLLPDAETYTNPIDRTVAHLLFHRPSQQFIKPVDNETPQSPISNYKLPLNIHGTLSEEQPESCGEMDVQPAPQK